ncbi:F0F1 ATP synthase subunit epsilon [Amaricoccus macauensis]|uniref:F0F1 ATP synthase subunit epsilon n=1 Tax=Amaricoccus macauensis TaxID=57001 RepID=UPI003C7A9066
MADTMQFDLVSPERKLASVAATSVQMPGMEGDFTAMPEHSPLLTTLRPGVVKVEAGADSSEFVVTGGFAEVTPNAASVLAELAVPRAEFSNEMLEKLVADADYELKEAKGDENRLLASQRVRDVAALKAQLSL